MERPPSQLRVVRFGAYVVDPQSFQLLKHGTRVRIQEQPLRILCLLLEQPGTVVTREQCQRALWPDNTFVDFDKGLNAGIARLRQVLLDSADNPRFIETIPRQGYRFICPVSYPEQEAAVEVSERDRSGTPAPEPYASVISVPSRARWGWIMAAAATLVFAALYLVMRPSHMDSLHEPISISRVTGTGDVDAADISPDGKYVAYFRQTQGRESLWLKQTGEERELRLLSFGEDQSNGPVFSPDGSTIYFVRRPAHSPDGTLYRLPLLGGDPDAILTDISGTPAISPDGQQVAFVRSTRSTHGMDALITDSISGGHEHELVRYPAPGIRQNRVVWSSDGKRLAYVAMGHLTVIHADGSGARLLPDQNWTDVEDIAASPWSGNEILVSGSRHGTASPLEVFQVSLDGDNTRQLTRDLTQYRRIRSTRNGDVLLGLAEQHPRRIQVVTFDKGEVTRAVDVEKQNMAGQWGISWTPELRILYAYVPYSFDRGEMWMADADGSNPHRIAEAPDSSAYADPVIPASGKSIFVSLWSPGDKANIWKLNIASGARTRLTDGRQDFPPAVSPDGKWVVYKSVLGDRPVLMKVPGDGGSASQVTDFSCDQPAISQDGKWIACFGGPGNASFHTLSILPFEKGQPRVFPLPSTVKTNARLVWTPDGRAVSFVNRVDGVSNIWNQPVTGGAPEPVTHFASEDIFHFDWSPDGRLVLSQGEDTTDVLLLRGSGRH